MSELAEVIQTIERVRGEFEDLAVRGLRASGPEHLAPLKAVRDEFERIGAAHVSSGIGELLAAIESDDSVAARRLLQAQTSLRMFERILTLKVAAQAFADDALSGEVVDSGEIDSGGDS